MRKLLALSIVSVLTLSACSSSKGQVSYLLNYKTQDASLQANLLQASERVINSRAKALGGKLLSKTAKQDGQKGRIDIGLSDPALEAPLTDGLVSPFSFAIMRKVEDKETPDLTVEKFGGFKKTDMTEKDLAWVTAGEDPANKTAGMANLKFTDDGKKKLQKTFTDNKGKTLGIFVRGQLTSLLQSTGDLQDNIVISGIPSKDLAGIFADDVNVGTYVTFSKAQ